MKKATVMVALTIFFHGTYRAIPVQCFVFFLLQEAQPGALHSQQTGQIAMYRQIFVGRPNLRFMSHLVQRPDILTPAPQLLHFGISIPPE
jgi:hypothetical protein